MQKSEILKYSKICACLSRFWWEREGVFTRAQRKHLRSVSLSRIICDNSHVTHVPADPFSRTETSEDMLACSDPLIPHLDISPWKEQDSGEAVENKLCRVWSWDGLIFSLTFSQIPAAVQYPGFNLATISSVTRWSCISVTLATSCWELHPSVVIQTASSGAQHPHRVRVRKLNCLVKPWWHVLLFSFNARV